MISGRTILRYLRNLNQYLGQFPYNEKSTYFEHLISVAFSRGLYLPYYTIDNDDESVEQRVTWQGSDSSGDLSKSPAGKTDIIAYCCGFYLVIEATRKTGSGQWTDEFAQALRHCGAFVRTKGLDPRQVYIVLVTTRLHEDTYCSLRHQPPREYKFVPLETEVLVRILETSILAFTMKNIELRTLFNKIPKLLVSSSSLEDFRNTLDEESKTWQKEVLKQEKDTFIGVKSYEAMKKINRPAVVVGEIFDSLLKHPFVGQYLNIVGEKLSSCDIEKILVNESLGCRAGRTIQTDEPLLECVPCTDFKGRGLRLIRAVEGIGC